jgi:hypothetical protein
MNAPNAKNDAEPRRHHYVPRCWLAGFTDTGEKDGQLWVTDLIRRKQWQAGPNTAGHIRDFYRLADERFDPLLAEESFSKIEDIVAPILRSIDREQRSPTAEEADPLMFFIALQWARVPSFRPMVFKALDDVTHEKLATDLKSKQHWQKALARAGLSENDPGAAYESMLEFYQSGEFSLTVQTDWYVKQTFQAAQHILPSLQQRHWRSIFSPTGSFISSDNPVIIDGPKGQMLGFKNAEIILYVLSRHVLVYSTLEPDVPQLVNRKYIAHMNTLSLLRAEQIFSTVPDFCWLDQERKYQTDWQRFEKSKF